MILPDGLLKGGQTITCSATANTVTVGTQIAAPGVGLRLRLWAFIVTPRDTPQAAANWRVFLTDGAAGPTIIGASGASFASAAASYLPGGIVVTTNTLVQWSAQSALASLVLIAMAYYTLEAA